MANGNISGVGVFYHFFISVKPNELVGVIAEYNWLLPGFKSKVYQNILIIFKVALSTTVLAVGRQSAE